MQPTQHATPCQVLLHPACTSNPDAIRAVQQATGRLVVVNGGKAKLLDPELLKSPTLFIFASGAEDFLSAHVEGRRFFIDECDTDPFDGGSAA